MSQLLRLPSSAARSPHAVRRSSAERRSSGLSARLRLTGRAAVLALVAAGSFASSATAAGAPIVTVPTAPAYDSAGKYRLSAQINANGSSTAANIQYGATTSYGKTFMFESLASNETRTFTRVTDAMPVGSTVHYRIVAMNASGFTYGPDQTYVVGAKPTVSVPSAPSYNSAGKYQLSAQVTSIGSSAAANIQYGATTSYGKTFTFENVAAGATHTFSRVTDAMPVGSTVHYRIVAMNAAGFTYGPDQTYVVGAKPTVTTAGRPTAWAATANPLYRFAGKVNANALPTTTRIEYGSTTNYGSSQSTSSVAPADTTTVIASLARTPGSTTNYRTVATNAAGTTYGPNQTFKAPTGIVRPVYMYPTDRPFRQDYNDLIVSAHETVQEFFAAQVGETFTVAHRPVLCPLPQNSAFYSSETQNSNGQWIGTWNKLDAALTACTGITRNSTSDFAVYPDLAASACNDRVGAAVPGLTFLSHTDLPGLDGETGFSNAPCGPGNDWRTGPWGYTGGLAHELGHTFGLPHPDDILETCEPPAPTTPACDEAYNSIMYVGYGDIRSTYLLERDKTSLRSSPFFS